MFQLLIFRGYVNFFQGSKIQSFPSKELYNNHFIDLLRPIDRTGRQSPGVKVEGGWVGAPKLPVVLPSRLDGCQFHSQLAWVG